MNIIKKFQEDSKRTAPFYAAPFNEQEMNWFLSNYTLGLIGESLELKQILDGHKKFCESNVFERREIYNNFIKESGDVWHYIVNLISALGEDFDSKKIGARKGEFYEQAGEFVECVKKQIYHGHGLDKCKLIEILYGIISEMLDINQGELVNVFETNIKKLKKRYPEKFTVADSIARVDNI